MAERAESGRVIAPDGYMTVRDIAEHFGRKVTTARGWILSGKLPGVNHDGRLWLVRKEHVMAFNPPSKPAYDATAKEDMTGVRVIGPRRVVRGEWNAGYWSGMRQALEMLRAGVGAGKSAEIVLREVDVKTMALYPVLVGKE